MNTIKVLRWYTDQMEMSRQQVFLIMIYLWSSLDNSNTVHTMVNWCDEFRDELHHYDVIHATYMHMVQYVGYIIA